VNTYKAHPVEIGVKNLPPKAVWLSPSLCRSLLALLKKVPSAYGWCRTRWSCATLAAQLQLQRGILVSASTLRRWLHRLGWVWKRAQLVARDDDPGRSRSWLHPCTRPETTVCWLPTNSIYLLPKVGYQWMPQGETVKLVTGRNQKRYLAGALELKTGRIVHCTAF
jgi:transposase